MIKNQLNSFGSRTTLRIGDQSFDYYRLQSLESAGVGQVSKLPISLKILLENLLRHEDGGSVKASDIQALACWKPREHSDQEIAFMPARVLMQDFTGVPAVVDLAAMRSAMRRLGGDPNKINPLQPADLVIDHSVQVDRFGSASAFLFNTAREFERNRERYAFLRWGQKAFQNFRVVPPGTGIVHQVNLEHLAHVVFRAEEGGIRMAYPDTLVGTDSHTTMINGLGVVGWGVGGIEAEAAMLGQPISMLIPEVVGFKLFGKMPEGTTATDLVLTVTQMLRGKGVVGKFVEFYGPGLSSLSLADRATIANMAPEYGATIGFFPVDAETLTYLRFTARETALVHLVEAYTQEQGLFRTDETPDPVFSDKIELDLATVAPSLAGPKRPQDRVPLPQAKNSFHQFLVSLQEMPIKISNRELLSHWEGEGGAPKSPPEVEPLDELMRTVKVEMNDERFDLRHGAVVIAAITSCTNTSNPAVMIGAGLLAKKAVERGLTVKPWVKTSLAPGSKVVYDYLVEAELMPFLEALRFHLVGYGCTTCIGNSGPLPEPIAEAVQQGHLVVASVLSGNRNFEGRINPLVQANYLASPPLVVAYALAGRMDIDLTHEPLGQDPNGKPVYFQDIWPSQEEVQNVIRTSVKTDMFRKEYSEVFQGDEQWNALEVPEGNLFAWDPQSTYIKCPPFLENVGLHPAPLKDIHQARVLALLGNSVTTDHISPAGSIPLDSPAAQYLMEQGVKPKDFNSFGSRRGNHEVMMRGTFGNIRLRNLLAPGTEGGWTVHLPEGRKIPIFQAAIQYQQEGAPLLIIAGSEYGTGSSRDWAAKGTKLLGVRAVLAVSFERIHRSNLVEMGVLPLQFQEGEDPKVLELTGFETYDLEGIGDGLEPGKRLTVRAKRDGGPEKVFSMIARVDTPEEVDYYQHDGILPYVLRKLLQCPLPLAQFIHPKNII